MKDELVDILDEQGNLINQTMMKSEAHAKSLWHPVVHLWIYNDEGKVLMQKRSHHKLVWPNVWDVAVAGHVAAGQTQKAAVIQEAGEELGLKVTADELNFIDLVKFEGQMDGWINRVFIWVYILQRDVDISQLTLEEEEVAEVKWMELDELETMLEDPGEMENFSPDISTYGEKVFGEIRRRKAKQ
jgi:isopentenyl-diphosphate delta-isomerase